MQPQGTNPVFDRLFESAAPRIIAADHERDEPPVDGGRWPVGVVASGAPQSFRERLQGLLPDLISYAGPGHS